MAEPAIFGVTPRMLELRAATSANYARRSVFVTTYLAYQSAAVHPRGAFALWSDRATTARLYSLIDNLVRRSPGLCDPSAALHVIHDVDGAAVERDGVHYHRVRSPDDYRQEWPADGQRWLLVERVLRGLGEWSCAYAIDATDVAVLRVPPCEALRDDELMVGAEAENSKGWLHKAGRRTGVHALLATPAYLSWLAKRDGDGVVANCGVVGGPRARLLRALGEVGRHLLAALRGAAPANASGIDMAVWNLALFNRSDVLLGYPRGPTTLPFWGALSKRHRCAGPCRHAWLNATRGLYFFSHKGPGTWLRYGDPTHCSRCRIPPTAWERPHSTCGQKG